MVLKTVMIGCDVVLKVDATSVTTGHHRPGPHKKYRSVVSLSAAFQTAALPKRPFSPMIGPRNPDASGSRRVSLLQ